MSVDAPEPFEIDVQPHRDTIVVAARGEIDMISTVELEGRLREVLGAGFKRVALDLRGVSFIDSTGLRLVLDVDSASRDAGVQFALIQGPEPVERLFELTGTERALRFIDPRQLERPWD